MPCVSYQRPNLFREGPTISVIVRPSSTFLSARKEQGTDAGEVPFVRSTMLIDTGASGSAVDPEVLAQLGLQPTGSIAIATPSHDHHDVLTYDIDLIIEQNLFHIADVPVFATGLKKQGLDGLIGRDVLRHMLLVYKTLGKQTCKIPDGFSHSYAPQVQVRAGALR